MTLPGRRLLASWASPILAALLALSSAPAPAAAARQSEAGGAGFVNLALPPGGEVVVENRRGGVRVEVWGEEQVALAASAEQGAGVAQAAPKPAPKPAPKRAPRRRTPAPARSPVGVERAEGALKITVARATAASAGRVDLTVRVPATARLKVYTADGEVEVLGLPASLDVQTLSGGQRVALPAPADAAVTAQSLNGSVEVGDGLEAARAPGRVLRGKFQARWGAGGAAVNLFSGRGRISLETLKAGANGAGGGRETARRAEPGGVAPDPGGGARRVASGRARVRETPEDAPFKAAPQRPAPAETPEEVDEDEVVRVESDLVTLNVSVVDRASGRGVHGLAAGDFRVYEDNVEQAVEHFETAEAPFDLLLVLDLSGSTARVTDTIRAAARRFVEVTRPQDRVGVVAFAGEAAVVSPLTSDRGRLRSALDRLSRPQGDTRLHDSLAYALDLLERAADPARRRALIVMSDGLDSTLPNVTGVGSNASYDEIRSRVQEFEGVVYTVWTNTEFYEAFSPQDIQPETYDLAHDRMEELAAAGGGVFYEVEKLEDLAGAYERVVADLGTVYSISYRPANKRRDGSWRAIRVRLPRRPEAVARGRRGYFAR
ncbi:MAG TPA: VWA domain-containing protein [Pyrinomonadaceae bacterium]